ncbi:hypothetical protein MP228_011541 [Amoeboaphelidium protococcarum]|nr:hypothetical protein MP228_011541 [Amoeboaphelidium protococcarum]
MANYQRLTAPGSLEADTSRHVNRIEKQITNLQLSILKLMEECYTNPERREGIIAQLSRLSLTVNNLFDTLQDLSNASGWLRHQEDGHQQVAQLLASKDFFGDRNKNPQRMTAPPAPAMITDTKAPVKIVALITEKGEDSGVSSDGGSDGGGKSVLGKSKSFIFDDLIDEINKINSESKK